MSHPSFSRLGTALACAGLVGLSGCVVAPYYRDYDAYPAGGEIVGVAPPPPQYEVIGLAPALGSVWISGYWGWSGGRHHWVPGRWAAGRSGYGWVPHGWSRAGGGWQLNGGYWRRH